MVGAKQTVLCARACAAAVSFGSESVLLDSHGSQQKDLDEKERDITMLPASKIPLMV